MTICGERTALVKAIVSPMIELVIIGRESDEEGKRVLISCVNEYNRRKEKGISRP